MLRGGQVEWKTLLELGTLERGRRFVHKDDRDTGIPAIHYGELYTYYNIWATDVKTHIDDGITTKLRYAQKGDVVIVGAGENNIDIGVGVAWLGDYDVAIHDACYILKHNQNPKFISYLLRTSDYHCQLKKYVSSGKICSVSAEGVGSIKFPIPPLKTQDKIVKILDSFDDVCNSMQSGIPAEIEGRRKQYEYYRDKLLTFEARAV